MCHHSCIALHCIASFHAIRFSIFQRPRTTLPCPFRCLPLYAFDSYCQQSIKYFKLIIFRGYVGRIDAVTMHPILLFSTNALHQYTSNEMRNQSLGQCIANFADFLIAYYNLNEREAHTEFISVRFSSSFSVAAEKKRTEPIAVVANAYAVVPCIFTLSRQWMSISANVLRKIN